MKPTRLIAAVAASALLGLAAPSDAAEGTPGKMTELANGLKYTDTTVGTGAEATAGHKVSVHYTGWLYNNGEKGKKFDSSLDRRQPFSFGLGRQQALKGWDEGGAGRKVARRPPLLIPPHLPHHPPPSTPP